MSESTTDNPFNRNPGGVNQHPDCPRSGDAEIEKLLREFHGQAITNRKLISQLLQNEYGIIMSESTVARRRKELGLTGKITSKQFVPNLAAISASGTSKKRRTARPTARPTTHVDRCLVTLEHEPPGIIEKCRLIGPATPYARIRQLEYAWGCELGSLNFDDPCNLFHLRADVRAWFDDGDWALLPGLDLMKKIYQDIVDFMVANNGQRPLYTQIVPHKPPSMFWTYSFVPLKLQLQNVIIYRRRLETHESQQVPGQPNFNTLPSYQSYHPPFTDFPQLESRVHPFFVIANAAEKFRKNIALVLRDPHLQEMRTALLPFSDLWTIDPPDVSLDVSSFPVQHAGLSRPPVS